MLTDGMRIPATAVMANLECTSSACWYLHREQACCIVRSGVATQPESCIPSRQQRTALLFVPCKCLGVCSKLQWIEPIVSRQFALQVIRDFAAGQPQRPLWANAGGACWAATLRRTSLCNDADPDRLQASYFRRQRPSATSQALCVHQSRCKHLWSCCIGVSDVLASESCFECGQAAALQSKRDHFSQAEQSRRVLREAC